MSKELLVSTTTGLTVYATGRVAIGDNGGGWGNIDDGSLDVFAGADWGKYDITMTELGSSGLYEADFPAVFNGERAVDIIFYSQVGASPAQSDTKLSGSLFELIDEWVPTVSLNV